MANGHGGARAGAGRKRRTEKYGRQVTKAEKRIADSLPDLVDKLFDLAKGVRVKEGDGIVYTRPPDRGAIEYLFNRVGGKPTERHEVDGNIDKSVVVSKLEIDV